MLGIPSPAVTESAAGADLHQVFGRPRDHRCADAQSLGEFGGDSLPESVTSSAAYTREAIRGMPDSTMICANRSRSSAYE